MNTSVQTIVLGMGCFWGAEKRMSAIPGVVDVECGYANGEIDGDYESVLAHERRLQRGQSPLKNHAEVISVTFDPARVALETILARFWENHDPTQGNRQGNDIGSNYRSAIYTVDPAQQEIALKSRDGYQRALSAAGKDRITTEILALEAYFHAEEYHQDYLQKNPGGYCGLGGTGVLFPTQELATALQKSKGRQLLVFMHKTCMACQRFEQDVLANWQAPLKVLKRTLQAHPDDAVLLRPISTTPCIVLIEDAQEIARFTGYDGDPLPFWQWLGQQLLSPEQQQIAFQKGTEAPFSGAHLDERRPGLFIDPITGTPLFRSDAKFESGCGWPSFFVPIEGALSFHEDHSHGMIRTEVRSVSSGIHLGHVFEDGPPPTGQRYCINGNVLGFVADTS